MGSKTFQKIFRTKEGDIVIGQPPNPPIALAVIFFVLAQLPGLGRFQDGLEALSIAFFITWAYLELTQGVNLFRKLLGVMGLSALAIMAFF